jgi:hypothetical protein
MVEEGGDVMLVEDDVDNDNDNDEDNDDDESNAWR